MTKTGNIYTAGEVGAINLMQSSCEVSNQVTSRPTQEQTDNIKNKTRGQGIQGETTRNDTRVAVSCNVNSIHKIMAEFHTSFRIMEMSHNNLCTKGQRLS